MCLFTLFFFLSSVFFFFSALSLAKWDQKANILFSYTIFLLIMYFLN